MNQYWNKATCTLYMYIKHCAHINFSQMLYIYIDTSALILHKNNRLLIALLHNSCFYGISSFSTQH